MEGWRAIGLVISPLRLQSASPFGCVPLPHPAGDWEVGRTRLAFPDVEGERKRAAHGACPWEPFGARSENAIAALLHSTTVKPAMFARV